jgi:1-acyl-sn-glycerol-3-phosphate acyltransferase
MDAPRSLTTESDDDRGGAAGEPRPRAQEARVSPEALAAARGGVREGLAWLGREPESRASVLYRACRLLARAVLFGAFRFRVETSGQQHLPEGGYLLVGAVHRGWMDPFLIQHALPPEPRVWFLGSGPSAFTSRWREALLHRLGGMLPVWRGGVGIDQHVAAARAVLRNGGVFVLMPEGGISGPPDRPAPFRFGSALICLRTEAPIVPFAIAGSDQLYLGRRMATRVLAPTTARDLLGADWTDVLPGEGSRAELQLAHRLTERLADVLGPAVGELYPSTVDPPDRPRRLRGLTWLLLARRRR